MQHSLNSQKLLLTVGVSVRLITNFIVYQDNVNWRLNIK